MAGTDGAGRSRARHLASLSWDEANEHRELVPVGRVHADGQPEWLIQVVESRSQRLEH
jgi:hypothetical protein